MTRLTAQQLSAVKLREALRSDGLDDLPDADLLERFARYGEHAAFEVLLRRHGPMVFGVCRRVLVNRADAEDAFQATFLVLVRKAKSVRGGDRLGPWLYGVAFRVAMKARARTARIAARRTEATDMIPDPTPAAEIPDWLPILDAELSALPEKYREPLVLCELQGASRADAAKALRIPEGTLSSRLARGRELLRRRLLKHGTLLPAGGLTALFTGSGVGRAAVPAGLFAKTSELAAVMATGAALFGTVPAGPARLTDEVLKSMFLTKLRLAGGAILAAGLMACGLLAALPHEAPAQPEKVADAKASRSKQETAPPSPKDFRGAGQELKAVEFVDSGTAVVPDREAIQGLWAVEKIDVGKHAKPDELKEFQDSFGSMRFLIVGDVWWGMHSHGVYPQLVKLESSKNPKWIDMRDVVPDPAANSINRGIYELDGDKLRICMSEGEKPSRPAEFTTEGDGELAVLHLRREKLSPTTGEKILNGSWENPAERIGAEGEKTVRTPIQRVEFVNGYMFALTKGAEWLGGRFTIDATKNPAWIDIDLVAPLDNKVAKLYGCYELADGQLKLALGTDGKRTFRPLEFKRADNVFLFDLKATKEPLGVVEKIVRKEITEITQPKPKEKPAPDSEIEEARKLIKASDFTAAEKYLRERLPKWDGLQRAEGQMLLGVCLIESARKHGPAVGDKTWKEAAELFGRAFTESRNAAPDHKHAAWIRTQCEMHNLQILQQTGKAKELLESAGPLVEKYHDTVEELIILSLMYNAYRQKGDAEKVLKTREVMSELFGKLKDKPGAFHAESGAYSQAFWEKTWFGDEPGTRR